MICRSCGALIKDSAVHCPYCKLKDPDLYRGRKESDYDALRPTRIQYPGDSAQRPVASAWPQEARLPRPEDPPVGYPKENSTTTISQNHVEKPIGMALPPLGSLPKPRQAEKREKSVIGTVVAWIFAIVMFLISFEGCDSFFS